MLTPNYSLIIMLNSRDYHFQSIISRVNTHPSSNMHSRFIYIAHESTDFMYIIYLNTCFLVSKITYSVRNFLVKSEHFKTLFHCCVEPSLEHTILSGNVTVFFVALVLPYFSFPTLHLGLCLEEQIGLDLQF